MKFILKVAAATLVAFSMNGFSSELSQVVNTEHGDVQGVRFNGISMYKGIPYAQAPVGDLRWKAPKETVTWQGVKSVDSFQAGCFQPKQEEFLPWSNEFLHQDSVSEDCLYLNIWSPNTKPEKSLPVVVYIHGGGFTSGSGSVPIYDGESLAKQGVVYVTLNYRLGAFGFLGATNLEEGNDSTSGDYGLLDQITALKWIKSNIPNFGGDSNNITIMGQSAGANSVLFLNASSHTKGLFQRSVIESPTPLFMNSAGLKGKALWDSPFTNLSLVAKKQITDAYITKNNLSIDLLKSMSAEQVLEALDPRAVPMTPSIGGQALDLTLYEAFTSTHRQNGEIIVGFNKDELSGFIQEYRSGGISDFNNYVEASYPSNASQIKKHYANRSRKDLNRDEGKVALKYLVENLKTFTGNKVFAYYFDQGIGWSKQKDYGTFHTSEVPFILSNLRYVEGPVTGEEYAVSKQFSSHLLQFAKTGDPSFSNHQWKDANLDSKWLMNINSNSFMSSGVAKDKEQQLIQLGVKN